MKKIKTLIGEYNCVIKACGVVQINTYKRFRVCKVGMKFKPSRPEMIIRKVSVPR